MAQNVLEMVIAAEDRFSDTFGRFDAKLNSMHNKADRLAGPLANATTALITFAAGVSAAGVALDVMALDKAVKAETAMANLRKVLNDDSVDLVQLGKTAEEFAVKYGTSFERAVDGMQAWAAEGKNAKDIQTGLLAAQRLAITGNIEEGEAANRLSSIMAALGGNFEYVHHVVDAVRTVANDFATTESNITLGLKEFIGVGAQQNLTLDQMIGLFTGIDVVTKNAGESGNALKTILVRLHAETSDHAKAWEMLGLSHKKANGEFVNSYDLLKQMAERWPSLTQEQQQFISVTFAGLYHVSKFNLEMRNMATVVKATESALNSEGSALKEVELRLTTTEYAIKRAHEGFNILLKHIGEQQTPALNGVAKSFAEVIQKIDRWNTETQAAGSVFNEFLKPAIDSFIAALDTLGNHFPEIMAKVDFGPLKQNLKDFSATLGALLSVDFSTVDGWAAAIQKAADTAAALVKTLQGVTTVLGGFLEVGGKALDWFNNLDAGTQKSIGYIGALALAFTALSAPIGAAIVVIGGLAGSYSALTLASTGAAAAGGAAAGGAAAAAGSFAALAAAISAYAGPLTIITVGLYTMVEGYRALAYAHDLNAEKEKSAAAVLDSVNQKLGTNYKTVDEATRALHGHNAALDTLKQNADLKVKVDTQALDHMREVIGATSAEVEKTASAIGATGTAGSGIASQVLATESERLTLLRNLYTVESGLATGMQAFTASFNGAQDKLTGAVEKSAQKFDALIAALGQQKQYSVDVTVQNADGAIRDLTQRVLEELIVRIKQENLLAITTG